ncbi:NAD(P)/FAD-dependent oxidoreductase [Proteinivorax hydrogeniformans]|uniref:NAD(P)/FAD-dependent oxidoreductase n=1 Tax=Proteinivorax hydrogeniformans TaxID=1826727 RepID=A0AAU8HVY6_9FIRM
MYDVAIIGAGVVGGCIAREMSKYNLKVVLIEKENDVACGTTKANSAIIHAGYDPQVGSLKSKLNLKGNDMFDKITQELSVPFKRTGSLVLAFNKNEVKIIQKLYENGLKSGVLNLQILSKKEVLAKEPKISEQVSKALYAPTAGIIGPWELTLALVENAINNGVDLKLNTKLLNIDKKRDCYVLNTTNESIKAKYIINAAGVHADRISNMVGDKSFKIEPNRGQYHLLDKSEANTVSSVIFQCPTLESKGVLVLPTVHGNLLVGPNHEYVEGKNNLKTTKQGLDYIMRKGSKSVEKINFRNIITSFSGLRAKTQNGDFIIEESKIAEGFFNVAGIDSPGLSAAPAIAEYVVELLLKKNVNISKKENFVANVEPMTNFITLDERSKQQLINKDSRYGRVVCRCENVTEGEIVEAVHKGVGASTLDGIKRRVRPGSGRCQGGFCGPKVMEIIAKETNQDITDIKKERQGSFILTGDTK